MIEYMQKEKNDNLFTPYCAIYPLLKYLPPLTNVWECCDPGNSKITELLKIQGYCVKSTDITTGTDFLSMKPSDHRFDELEMIITNPPYSLKDEFLEHCYNFGVPFALLLPLTALEGYGRGNLYRKFGISVIVLDKRVNFTDKNNVWFNTSWFTWGILPKNSLVFERVLDESN